MTIHRAHGGHTHNLRSTLNLPAAPALLLIAALACGPAACNSDSAAPPSRERPVSGVDEACTIPGDCRDGLTCVDNACIPAGDTAEGQPCQLTGQCADGLYCDNLSRCSPAGEGLTDAPCGSTADCTSGFICVPSGLSGLCQEAGRGDVEEPCGSTADCLAGLGCAAPLLEPEAEPRCLPANEGGAVRPFAGVQCQGDSSTPDGAMRMYFEVPGADPPAEFYRMPFPNDARRNGTRPQLAGHPTPGDGVLGFDLIQSYLDTISTQQQGFGLNQAVYMRFSGRLDFDVLDARGETPSHYLVDITPDSPEYNERQPIFWQAATEGSRYLCHNWLSMRPSWGRPLEPNTTYAAIITDQAVGREGQALEQDQDFAAMLGEDRPAPELIDAWNAYAPLRAYIAEQSIDPQTVKGAAVFTTGDPRAITRQLRQVVRDAGTPEGSDLTLCGAETVSPCDDGLEGDQRQRGCFGAQDAFDEIHGRVQLPIFQRGQAPYFDTGGDVEVAAAPVIQRNEDVCMAMTVPKADMPEEGWPVLIYAHGTGGSFRSHVGNISEHLTEIDLGQEGGPTRMLVIGWDQVQHFTRRGDSTLDPETLVYNFTNPPAALGNFLQGAADLHAITAYVEALDIAAEDSPTGARIKADPSQIYFLGHSQGATSGSLALPYEPLITKAILSGAGASLTYSLLGKTSPINIPAGVQLALQDPDVGENHPVLSLMQGFFDPVDPLNYAQYIGARQIADVTTPRHVLHTIGIGDTFTPQLTLQTMAVALRTDVVSPLIEDFRNRTITPIEPPVSDNKSVGGQRFTVLSRQYEPADYDGHFVLFQNPQAIDDMLEFLVNTALED